MLFIVLSRGGKNTIWILISRSSNLWKFLYKIALIKKSKKAFIFQARENQIEGVKSIRGLNINCSQNFSWEFLLDVTPKKVFRSQLIFDDFCLLKQKRMLSVFWLKVLYFLFCTMDQKFESPIMLNYSVWRKFRAAVLSGSVENGLSPIQTMY